MEARQKSKEWLKFDSNSLNRCTLSSKRAKKTTNTLLNMNKSGVVYGRSPLSVGISKIKTSYADGKKSESPRQRRDCRRASPCQVFNYKENLLRDKFN
jgi:hypothetical protein